MKIAIIFSIASNIWQYKYSTQTLSNSGATITNSASNGSGSGLANQHQVLHVIIIKQKSEFFRLKRHATFHKRIQSKTEKSSNAMVSVSQTTSSALSNERNHFMQIGLSSRSVGPLLDWVAVLLWLQFFDKNLAISCLSSS